MVISSSCRLHMGASPHTPEVLRIEAKWMEKRGMTRPQVAAGPPSTRHQPRRSGRSSALPYPPGWHGKNREAFGRLQEKKLEENQSMKLNG